MVSGLSIGPISFRSHFFFCKFELHRISFRFLVSQRVQTFEWEIVCADGKPSAKSILKNGKKMLFLFAILEMYYYLKMSKTLKIYPTRQLFSRFHQPPNVTIIIYPIRPLYQLLSRTYNKTCKPTIPSHFLIPKTIIIVYPTLTPFQPLNNNDLVIRLSVPRKIIIYHIDTLFNA